MFSKFDENAQKIIISAKSEMQSLCHPYVGSEHVMLAILNNNTVKTFSNNVIGFPSSTNDKFILKRENTNGSVSYSWIPFQHVSGNVNFTTTKYYTYITTEKQSINIDSNDTGLIVIDILIDDIATLCNMNVDVIININDYHYKITPWIKFQQIIIESTESSINISSNINDNIIMIDCIRVL